MDAKTAWSKDLKAIRNLLGGTGVVVFVEVLPELPIRIQVLGGQVVGKMPALIGCDHPCTAYADSLIVFVMVECEGRVNRRKLQAVPSRLLFVA